MRYKFDYLEEMQGIELFVVPADTNAMQPI